MARRSDERIKVAVVGTGMAGLATAYLINIRCDRYDVHVFESGQIPSLDAASVKVEDSNGRTCHVDVPMRAFSEGYYHNLKAMYDYLGIQYRRQPMRYIFARKSDQRPYFTHSSNDHRPVLPELSAIQIGKYIIELCFVVVCYAWFTVCCLLVQPDTSECTGLSETLRAYLERIMIPNRFVSLYLLPLFSVVATCSHSELLDFPASDVVDYRRSILFGNHFVVSDGIQEVQSAFTNGLNIKTSSRVTEIVPEGSRFRLKLNTYAQEGEQFSEHHFDRVVLAIPPNEVASLYSPIGNLLRCFSTRSVTTVAHGEVSQKTLDNNRAMADEIHLTTSSELGGWTQARHVHRCGIHITSNLLHASNIPEGTFSRSNFTRVLRNPASKRVVDDIFDYRSRLSRSSKQALSWRNGNDGVWLAGAWCWDGMVLLEGAVVSAMRIAKDFDIEIPWSC